MGTVPDRTAASTGIRRSAVRDGSPGLLPPSPRRPAGALSCVWAQTARRYGSDASLFRDPGLRRGRRASRFDRQHANGSGVPSTVCLTLMATGAADPRCSVLPPLLRTV